MATVSTFNEERIQALDRKLDFIVEELAHLKSIRVRAQDLAADLMPAGDATEGCGSAAPRRAEIEHLLKTVLMDARLLESALHQLESAADFVADAQPIVRSLFHQAVACCQLTERKGYFDFARTGVRIGDKLVQAHSAEDLKQVEASVPQFVGFLRELTRPEVLEALEAIIHGFGRVQATMNVDKSFFAIARDLNSTEARRGIAILVEFLKVVGAGSTTAASAQTTTAPQSTR
jgi:uncharacterized protein YjgD (DUF1641 family)